MAWFQNLTVVLKFLPLLFVGVVGWFFVSKANFGPFNASGGSLYGAIGIAAGVALFSFIGVEVAAITAKRVKNPRVNVGRASLLGTGLSAILYLAVSAAVMGLVPHHELVDNTAPFVTAFGTIFTHGAWAGKLVAALAVTSGIGALNGWTLVTTEMARAAADDGLFPRRVRLDRPQGHRLVRRGDGGAAALAADAVELHHGDRADGLHRPGGPDRGHRRHPVPLLGLPRSWPTWCRSGAGCKAGRWPGTWPSRCLGVLFSMWVTFAAGYQSVYQALVLVLAGVVLYAFLKAHREDTGQVPAEPEAQVPTPAEPEAEA